MNNSIKSMLLAAASAGLMSGATTAPAVTMATSNGTNGPSASTLGAMNPGLAAQDPAPKHSCKGQNSCKGQGGCKTSDMGCKGKNSCKGRGGCKTDSM